MHLHFYLSLRFGLAFKSAVLAHTQELDSWRKTSLGWPGVTWADVFQDQLNIVKNITLKLSQAQKEHSLWKDYFPERCWILSSIGAIEFREFIKYMGEIERTCVCVCVCVCVSSQTNNLVIPYNPTFETALKVIFLLIFRYSTLCFVKKLTSHTGKYTMAIKLKEAFGSRDPHHLF